jgi:cell division transport system permease protein
MSELSDKPQTVTQRPLDDDDVIPVHAPEPPRERELAAPARPSKAEKGAGSAPIVPAGSVTGRSLTLVIAIMCCLACLTAGAVYMINQSAAAWIRNIASEVSVQIEPVGGDPDTDKVVEAVSAYLREVQGVAAVKPMSKAESAELLEPWLGKSQELAALPIPRLIALELNRRGAPNLEQLRQDLEQRFPGTVLDDHRHWQSQIRTVTRSLALGGLSILLLVGAATTAIIISATRSAMASNREIVEVLHFVGATDRFIAREFEKHFLALGIRAGLVGAGVAAAVFLTLPVLVPLLGGGAVAAAEVRNLVGGAWLDVSGFCLLGIVVIVIAALCMLTSRYSVFRILHLRE